MFTLNHFIWLGISIVIIVGMLLLVKFKKLSFNCWNTRLAEFRFFL